MGAGMREKKKQPGDLQKRRRRHKIWQAFYDVKKRLQSEEEFTEVIGDARYTFSRIPEELFGAHNIQVPGTFAWRSRQYGPVVQTLYYKEGLLCSYGNAWLPVECRKMTSAEDDAFIQSIPASSEEKQKRVLAQVEKIEVLRDGIWVDSDFFA
jgi:hypothetical protein